MTTMDFKNNTTIVEFKNHIQGRIFNEQIFVYFNGYIIDKDIVYQATYLDAVLYESTDLTELINEITKLLEDNDRILQLKESIKSV